MFIEQILEYHRGEGMETFWRDNVICPTEMEYKQMTVCKTGGLILLMFRLMQLFSDNKKDFARLASFLGLYFQIRDDFIDSNCNEVSVVIPLNIKLRFILNFLCILGFR